MVVFRLYLTDKGIPVLSNLPGRGNGAPVIPVDPAALSCLALNLYCSFCASVSFCNYQHNIIIIIITVIIIIQLAYMDDCYYSDI